MSEGERRRKHFDAKLSRVQLKTGSSVRVSSGSASGARSPAPIGGARADDQSPDGRRIFAWDLQNRVGHGSGNH